MYSTSININFLIFRKIELISKDLNISKATLIREIIKYTCLNYHARKNMNGLTRYQKSRKNTKWKCFRLKFSEDECRLFFKCRFLYRVSVSKMLFVGFILFLDEVVEKIKKGEISEKNIKKVNCYTSLRKELLIFIKDEMILFKKYKNNTLKS